MSAMMKEMPSVTSTCALLVAGEPAQDEPFHEDAEQPDAEPADDRRQPEVQPELQQREAEIGAEHEERAVRQVRDAHQAEDQREAGRQQEQAGRRRPRC